MYILKEASNSSSAHIYVDDATGDYYIFDGTKLVKLEKEKAKNPPKGNNSQEQHIDDPPIIIDVDDADDDANDDEGQDNDNKNNNHSPTIGDRGNEDILRDEDEKRKEQIKKEREEDGEDAEEEESEEEYQKRLDKIKRFLNDEDIGNSVKSDSESKVRSERARKKAAEKKEMEKNLKGAAKNSHVMKQLSNDLRGFLAKEVGAMARNHTWRAYNANYHNSGILRPGIQRERVGKIPVIQIYIDQSGSWSEAEVAMGKEILQSIMEFERKGQIRSKVYYFADHIHSDAASARREGGTHAGTELMEQLNAMKPDNVIVITDSDFDWAGLNGSYTAPGGVWMVFREARSKLLMQALHGKKLTKYYDIDRVY